MARCIKGNFSSPILVQGDLSRAWVKENLVNRIKGKPDVKMHAVRDDGQIKIGIILNAENGCGVLTAVHDEDGRTLRINKLGLVGSLRGIGAGGRLISTFMRYATARDMQAVTLFADRADGPPFWHAHGWAFNLPDAVAAHVADKARGLAGLTDEQRAAIVTGLRDDRSATLRALSEDPSRLHGERLSSLLFRGFNTPCRFDLNDREQRAILTAKLGASPFDRLPAAA